MSQSSKPSQIKNHSTAPSFIMGLFNRIIPSANMGWLFSGQVISQIGDSINHIGLMWLVLDMTDSKSSMGLVAVIGYLPILIFGFPGGILADRMNRKRVMMGADLFRSLFILLIPLCFFLGELSLFTIFAVSFMISGCTALFNPARDAIIPDLATPIDLLKSNSLIQVSSTAAILLGPALGAYIINAFGVIHLFTLDALTYLLSLTAIAFISQRKFPAKISTKTQTSFTESFRETGRVITERPRLLFLMILTGINNFFIMGPAIVGTPVFVREILGKGAISYALVQSCFGVGMIIGTFLVNHLTQKMNKGRVLLIGMIFDGFTYAILFFIDALPLFMVMIAFHAIGIPLIVVSRTSLIQEWIPRETLGRIFSIVSISVVGVTALTCGATGFLADVIPINVIFGISGVIAMITGIVGWSHKSLRES